MTHIKEDLIREFTKFMGQKRSVAEICAWWFGKSEDHDVILEEERKKEEMLRLTGTGALIFYKMISNPTR